MQLRNSYLWIYLLFTLFACTKSENHTGAIQITELIPKDFSGVVHLSQNGDLLLGIDSGFANREDSLALEYQDLFVIGSVSKQITAAMIMKAKEGGLLALEDTIDKFLPDLSQDWKTKVTIHHLLTHRHGIISLNDSLAFELDSQFQYSQIGYALLSNILEVIYKDSFESISQKFFNGLGLENTYHPNNIPLEKVVRSYIQDSEGNIIRETANYPEYTAAGGFISNVSDMAKWNELLHEGKVVNNESLKLMSTKYAVRTHPIFGEVNYGYGLLFMEGEETIQIGALGYAPGFVSASYYYPQTNCNLVILSNKAVNLDDFRETFGTHTKLMDMVKSAK